MKCEDVFARLETGHAINRWRARRHVAGCDSCVAAIRSFANAKEIWGRTEPVSAQHQALWDAAGRQAVIPARSWNQARLAIAGFSLAASLLLVYLAWPPKQDAKNDDQHQVARQVETPSLPTTIVPHSEEYIAADFAPLEGKLKALEEEIDRIQAGAEKYEAQIQLAQLIHQYSKRENDTP